MLTGTGTLLGWLLTQRGWDSSRAAGLAPAEVQAPKTSWTRQERASESPRTRAGASCCGCTHPPAGRGPKLAQKEAKKGPHRSGQQRPRVSALGGEQGLGERRSDPAACAPCSAPLPSPPQGCGGGQDPQFGPPNTPCEPRELIWYLVRLRGVGVGAFPAGPGQGAQHQHPEKDDEEPQRVGKHSLGRQELVFCRPVLPGEKKGTESSPGGAKPPPKRSHPHT